MYCTRKNDGFRFYGNTYFYGMICDEQKQIRRNLQWYPIFTEISRLIYCYNLSVTSKTGFLVDRGIWWSVLVAKRMTLEILIEISYRAETCCKRKATNESFHLQYFSALGDISINISSVIRLATKTLHQKPRLECYWNVINFFYCTETIHLTPV